MHFAVKKTNKSNKRKLWIKYIENLIPLTYFGGTFGGSSLFRNLNLGKVAKNAKIGK